MPIPWLLVLQSVPWTEVIKNAPKVAEGAMNLWRSVGSKNSGKPDSMDQDSATPDEEMTLAQMQIRIEQAEFATAELHAQMLASSELIKALAEQNAELILRIEINTRRVIGLAILMFLFGLVVLIGLYGVMGR